MEPLFRLATAVVAPAIRWWLLGRQKKNERELSLPELIDIKVTDNFRKKDLRREIEALGDVMAERLTPVVEIEFRDLQENERSAAIQAVIDSFMQGRLDDEQLFATDLRPDSLARQLRETMPDMPSRAGLSDTGGRLYDLLLAECCSCYIRLVQQLAPFQSRAISELLGRVTGLANQLRQVLDKIPRRSLDAPAGDDFDEEFLQRYLSLLHDELDAIEVFGVDLRNFRPQTSVDIAYVSLSVTTQNIKTTPRRTKATFKPGAFSRGSSEAPSGVVRVENVLSGATRIIIRGEAGSGKTTLLRWLAVTATKNRWNNTLRNWRNTVPFFIKLRSYAGKPLPKPSQFLDGTADILTDLMPAGWVHRQLSSEYGLLLIDGVDELVTGERPQVRTWLRRLSRTYPKLRIVVTSRPAATAAEWLQREGFSSASLERMSASDVRRFVAHWHDAVRSAGGYPCEERELPYHERSLLSQLDANLHLAALATNPLLCAMLCALNLDRASQLPRDRLGIYRAALELLIERREVIRKIPSYNDLSLDTSEKLHLLRHLAWRMSVNGRIEEERTRAEKRVAEKLRSLTNVADEPSAVLSHLIQRSGVIREPVVGYIDFVHRTFQEYLTALECAEQGDIELLRDKAHLDQWRDVIVMAIGSANNPFRLELLSQLRRMADSGNRHTRQLRLVIASCFDALPAPTPELQEIRDSVTASLLPPREAKEAQSLASTGPSLLRRFPADFSALTEAQAAASVRTLALINGPEALKTLARQADDQRTRVQRELVRAWSYFDPVQYAESVLAKVPLIDGKLTLTDAHLLPHVQGLSNVTQLTVDLSELRDLSILSDIPNLVCASVTGNFSDLAPIRQHVTLEEVYIESTAIVKDLAPISDLPSLTSLAFFHPGEIADPDFFAQWADLEFLGLGGCAEIVRGMALGSLRKLSSLELRGCTDFDPRAIEGLPIDTLLLECAETRGGFWGIAESAPNLAHLTVFNNEWADDLSGLRGMPELLTLTLGWLGIEDLKPIESLQLLDTFYMWECDAVRDLSVFLTLNSLQYLYIPGLPDLVDYAPLARLRAQIYVDAEEAPFFRSLGIKVRAW